MRAIGSRYTSVAGQRGAALDNTRGNPLQIVRDKFCSIQAWLDTRGWNYRLRLVPLREDWPGIATTAKASRTRKSTNLMPCLHAMECQTSRLPQVDLGQSSMCQSLTIRNQTMRQANNKASAPQTHNLDEVVAAGVLLY